MNRDQQSINGAMSGDDNEPVSFVETPGPFHPIEELRAYLAGIPQMGLSQRQEMEVREEVEEALAFRLANPLPGDPGFGGGAASIGTADAG